MNVASPFKVPPKAVSTAYSFGGSAQDFDGDLGREG